MIKKFDSSLKHFNKLKYASYGTYPVVPIFLGLTTGLVLDSILNTRPILVLVFLFLGVLGSFYNLVQLVKSIKKNDNGSH